MKRPAIITSHFIEINVSNITNVPGERRKENNNKAKQKIKTKQKQT